MIHMFDTASRTVKELQLREPEKVSMYVCGPTVYGPPHLGHGRFALVFDVLRRYLTWSGLDVTYVSNITDIDDNIINRANDEGISCEEVAETWEKVWWEAMDSISVLRPDSDPHATGYVAEMVDLIGRLLDADAAYVTSDGIYLSVSSVGDYGLLANQSLDELLAGGGDRVLIGDEKRNAADFAVWKFAKAGEPSWPSPWGDGRPGWHTECVVMSLDLLGEGFDIHGGGLDLAFPHHENERAQAVALGSEFARHWVHNGFVEVGGEKMSKSLGNFTTLTDLVAQHDQRAYRLLVLQSHYRSPVEVTAASISNAEAALRRLDNFADRVGELVADPHAAVSGAGTVSADVDGWGGDPDERAEQMLAEFRERMDDDMDTPGAVAIAFTGVTEVNRYLDSGDEAGAAPVASTVLEILSALGLEVGRVGEDIPADIVEMCARRDAARTERDWAVADSLRDELTELGWVVEDSAEGTVVRHP